MNVPAAIRKTMSECPAYRISPNDTNYFAVVFDTTGEQCDLVAVVEIFEPGGRTPPNRHQRAHEMFFVLEGEGDAYADGSCLRIAKGDALMIKPGTSHAIQNVGAGKLYCLTVMTPDEDFAALIRAGTPVQLQEDDMSVLGRGILAARE
jgi:mannose-6-phosphate isomerase-like protein (cupin superfamily)